MAGAACIYFSAEMRGKHHLYWLLLRMQQIPQQVRQLLQLYRELFTMNEGKEQWQVEGNHLAISVKLCGRLRVWVIMFQPCEHYFSQVWTHCADCICTGMTLAGIQSQFKPDRIRWWSGEHDHIHIIVHVVGIYSIPCINVHFSFPR